jgi:regulator of RNase E activity RraA
MSTIKPQSADLHAGLGFRFRECAERVAPEVVRGFEAFATPDISDLMNRLYSMNDAIKNQTDPSLRLIGPACTVKVFPGDNLMVHKALDLAQPGDVIVVDASSSTMTAVLGDLVSMKAKHRHIAGFIVDGLIRDLPGILAVENFPVFARGITPIGPLHRGPGEINYPVSVGGIVVHAGDLVVADMNGVVVIPREDAAELLERLNGRAATEREYVAAVARGEFSNDWVDATLRSGGATFDSDPAADKA